MHDMIIEAKKIQSYTLFSGLTENKLCEFYSVHMKFILTFMRIVPMFKL